MKKITTMLITLSSLGFSWTANHQWEIGDTITWNVPYQSQESFRNWTSACMPTSGAMIVNFFYSGASFKNFNGANHVWNQTFNINNPYQTTGQRMYAQGIVLYNNVDTDLNNYLKNYPKSGINQYYNTNVNDKFGPLNNEWFGPRANYIATNINNGSAQGLNTNLIDFFNKKHHIKTSSVKYDNIFTIRNNLYNGPVILSVSESNGNGYRGGHIIVATGIDSNGNLIINDPWGAQMWHSPTSSNGNNKKYSYSNATTKILSAYGKNYRINYNININVRDNFTRANNPFSPYNVPVEANVKFKYDGSGTLNNSYDGDGDYSSIYNGFSIWNPQNDLKYYYGSELGFLYAKTTIGDATNAVRWTPNIPKDGKYQVLAGFLANGANSSHIDYTIYHTDGENIVSINQKNTTNAIETRNNITYKSLGSYCFDDGINKDIGSVHLTNKQNEANKDINIDIMKFVYLGDCDTPTKNIVDGAGSIINPSNIGKWGSDRDEADMQKHSSSSSTVVFQWYRPPNTDTCKYLDMGILECNNNGCGVSDNKHLDVIIHHKKWSESDSIAYKTSLPITIKKVDAWNTIAITSQNPISSTKKIVAYCKKHIIHTPNKEDIDSTNIKFESGYTWAGNSSIIRRDNPTSTQHDGISKDVAIGLSDEKSVTLFQWQPSSNCLKLKLKSGHYPNDNGKYANVDSVDMKFWNGKIWNLRKKCNGKLPCTLNAPNGADGYYIIRVRAKSSAFDKNRISAVCTE